MTMKFFNSVNTQIASFIMIACFPMAEVSASSYDIEFEERLSIDSVNLSEMFIDVGAGDLYISGVEGSTMIEVVGKIHANDANEYTFTLEQKGDRAVLVAKTENDKWTNYHNAFIDVEVRLPKHVALKIEDSSGDVEVVNSNAGLVLNDSSGDVLIRSINSDVTIDDGSGSIRIYDTDGDLVIDDGSGDVLVKNTNGTVTIEDGSGDIRVQNALSLVTVDDGSGDIHIETAEAVKIINEGSGDTYLKNIKSDSKP